MPKTIHKILYWCKKTGIDVSDGASHDAPYQAFQM